MAQSFLTATLFTACSFSFSGYLSHCQAVARAVGAQDGKVYGFHNGISCFETPALSRKGNYGGKCCVKT